VAVAIIQFNSILQFNTYLFTYNNNNNNNNKVILIVILIKITDFIFMRVFPEIF
jgi:hypothetical protein